MGQATHPKQTSPGAANIRFPSELYVARRPRLKNNLVRASTLAQHKLHVHPVRQPLGAFIKKGQPGGHLTFPRPPACPPSPARPPRRTLAVLALHLGLGAWTGLASRSACNTSPCFCLHRPDKSAIL